MILTLDGRSLSDHLWAVALAAADSTMKRKRVSIAPGPPVVIDAAGYPKEEFDRNRTVIHRGVDRATYLSVRRGYTKHRKATVIKAMRGAYRPSSIASAA